MPAKFFQPSQTLQANLDELLEKTWDTFPDLAQNQIAVTWISYDPPYRVNTGGSLSAEEFWQYQPQGASYRGVELIEPGRLVSLFYLVATHVWLEQGMVASSAEMERAMQDMMTPHGHDATSYILDVLTGTTSGPELPAGPMATWESQRNIVNRYFKSLGWPELRSVNISQKTWCDRPYGRERDFFGKTFDNQNKLTSNAIARLMHSIVGGVSASSARSQAIMATLQQASASQALHLPALLAQASISPNAKHYAAYVESESTHPYLLCVLTEQTTKADDTALMEFVLQGVSQAAQQAFRAADSTAASVHSGAVHSKAVQGEDFHSEAVQSED